MKIASSNVALKSSHSLTARRTQTTSLSAWSTGGALSKGRLSGADGENGADRAFRIDIGARQSQNNGFSIKRLVAAKAKRGTDKSDNSVVCLKLLEELIYHITGKRIRLGDPNEKAQDMEDAGGGVSLPNAQVPMADAPQGYGMIFSSTETYFEAESVNFAASGTVDTADGRSLTFDLRLSMERSYYEQHSLEIRLGDAARTVDPLAVNLGGTIGLTQNKFAFDLDSDGTKENISFLSGQAGFLALDQNGDGVINDGSELFGTKSGDGFYDLAVYDEDGNGWIDESDAVFSKLKLFNMSEDGSATLISLGAAGVGALYLRAANTDFSFKQGAELQGQMKKSSIYLKENGTAGTLHHIDLAI